MERDKLMEIASPPPTFDWSHTRYPEWVANSKMQMMQIAM